MRLMQAGERWTLMAACACGGLGRARGASQYRCGAVRLVTGRAASA